MLTVKAPAIEFTIPSSWEEVTLRQFIDLHGRQRVNDEGESYYTLRAMLECFCSDVTQLHQLGAFEEAELINCLPYLKAWPDFASLVAPVTIAGVTPPDQLGACSLLQKWSVEDLVKEYEEEERGIDFVSLAVPVLSIYLYPLLTGQPLTDTGQIADISHRIKALPVTDALPLSAFFLTNFQHSTPIGRTSYAINYPSLRPKRWLTHWFRSWWRTTRS